MTLLYLTIQTSDSMYLKQVRQMSSMYGTNCACISLSTTNVRRKCRRFAHGESSPISTFLTAEFSNKCNNVCIARCTVGRSLRLSLTTNLWNMIDNPAPRRVKCNDFSVSSSNKYIRYVFGSSEYSSLLYKHLK